MLISGSIFIVSFLALYITLSLRVVSVRRGTVSVSADGRLFNNIFSVVDVVAFYIVMGLKRGVHHTYLFLLVISHNIISLVKYIVLKVEGRFIKMIDSVRGKGVTHKKGSASLFLREIKKHQDSLKSN